MSDIFISYSSEERHRVLPLVDALEKTGWLVFWDRTIPAGKTWRQVIGAEIRTCRSVLVVWTESSVTSEWVLEEAETGKRKQILIPVLLDEVEPPFGFGTIQAANLTGWNGDNSSPPFTHLVAGIAAILGPAPVAVKEAEERRRLEGEVGRGAERERFQQHERQRSEAEAQRKADENKPRPIEQEAHRGGPRDEKRMPSEVEQASKASPGAPPYVQESQAVSVPEHFIRSNRRQLYAAGAVVVIIGAVVMAFLFFGPAGSREAGVQTVVSLAIQGKRQLNTGEKSVLRVEGRFSDGSKTDVRKHLHWQSSNDSVAAVSEDGQVEARKDGSTDVTVRYEGIASPPLALVVRGESPSIEADAAGVITRIQEHVKMAGSYRDQGEYSTALAELAKAKSLDPANKTLQEELESTKKACLAEQRIGLTKSRCE